MKTIEKNGRDGRSKAIFRSELHRKEIEVTIETYMYECSDGAGGMKEEADKNNMRLEEEKSEKMARTNRKKSQTRIGSVEGRPSTSRLTQSKL